ncbi:hypothetical protein [Rhodobium gokarnense]|uniref:Lipoprotein n=1 Tax=Rhodobium gokarnense TaxID=364296 RepID=A0ABT3HAH2_9HYPH|nr:hypothetical protein [Rhodobium gokarnense]MCW2307404.1 hypothetical protein [Rhodobium gokarnense]
MMINRFILFFATLAVAACAKSPESISPAYVSDLKYRDYTCEQLNEEDIRLTDAYTVAAKQQEKARSNDTVGVILIGLPVSSLSGDNIAPEIARLKGERQAVQQAIIAKNCSS